MSTTAQALTLATALACMLVGGVFYAFSTFVMGALARLDAPQGIAAMQSINVVVLTPAFMVPLFGTSIACLALVVAALIGDGWPVAGVIAGAALYALGTTGVTIAANVPLNERLARLDGRSAEAAATWREYVVRWTRWNHVRTLAALAAAIVLTIAAA